MRINFRRMVLLILGLLCSGRVGFPQVIVPVDHHVSQMSVQLKNSNGLSAGTATISKDKEGVKIRLDLMNLPPGLHAFQLNQNAKCKAPAFTSAGERFRQGANFTVKSDGRAKVTAQVLLVTLRINGWLTISGSGGQQRRIIEIEDSTSIFQNGGKSLVIVDPSGNAVACGEVTIPNDQLLWLARQ